MPYQNVQFREHMTAAKTMKKVINLYRHLTWIVHSVTREKRDVLL
jgi:hypothetical protein